MTTSTAPVQSAARTVAQCLGASAGLAVLLYLALACPPWVRIGHAVANGVAATVNAIGDWAGTHGIATFVLTVACVACAACLARKQPSLDGLPKGQRWSWQAVQVLAIALLWGGLLFGLLCLFSIFCAHECFAELSAKNIHESLQRSAQRVALDEPASKTKNAASMRDMGYTFTVGDPYRTHADYQGAWHPATRQMTVSITANLALCKALVAQPSAAEDAAAQTWTTVVNGQSPSEEACTHGMENQVVLTSRPGALDALGRAGLNLDSGTTWSAD